MLNLRSSACVETVVVPPCISTVVRSWVSRVWIVIEASASEATAPILVIAHLHCGITHIIRYHPHYILVITGEGCLEITSSSKAMTSTFTVECLPTELSIRLEDEHDDTPVNLACTPCDRNDETHMQSGPTPPGLHFCFYVVVDECCS